MRYPMHRINGIPNSLDAIIGDDSNKEPFHQGWERGVVAKHKYGAPDPRPLGRRTASASEDS